MNILKNKIMIIKNKNYKFIFIRSVINSIFLFILNVLLFFAIYTINKNSYYDAIIINKYELDSKYYFKVKFNINNSDILNTIEINKETFLNKEELDEVKIKTNMSGINFSILIKIIFYLTHAAFMILMLYFIITLLKIKYNFNNYFCFIDKNLYLIRKKLDPLGEEIWD